MNDKLNIDKTIKDKFDGFSVEPPSHVWDNIQGQMAAQKRKKRMMYISWIAAAAVVVFAFVAGWVLNDKATLLPEVAEQKVEQTFNEEDSKVENILIDEPANEEDLVAQNQTPHITKSENTQKIPTTTRTINEVKDENAMLTSFKQVSYALMERIDAIFSGADYEAQLAERKVEVDEWQLTASDKVLIAENIENNKTEKSKEGAWKVGTLISPGYASNSSNHSQEYAQNMNYNGDNGSANVGAGFSVQYKTGKRLRIESGVYYSQNGQSSNSSGSGLFNLYGGVDYQMLADAEYRDASSGFSNAVTVNDNGIDMNSTAGVINMSSAPKGAIVATNLESLNSKNANTLTTSGEFSQVFQFVEIPLYLRYNVLDKRFGIELMGGFNAGMVVGNNAYIDNEYGKQNIGSTEDISAMNLSGTIGLGMNYGLGKHFSLALEPRLNYYLNSINSNPDVDFRPYRIGIFTGVYYEF